MSYQFPVILKKIFKHEDFYDYYQGYLEASDIYTNAIIWFNQNWETSEELRNTWEHLRGTIPNKNGRKPSPFRGDEKKSAQSGKQNLERYFKEVNDDGKRKTGSFNPDTKVLYALYFSAINRDSGRQDLKEWTDWDKKSELPVFQEYTKWKEEFGNVSTLTFLESIVGVWRVYIQHEDGVYQTYCRINEDLSAQYISLHFSFEMEGKVILLSQFRFQLHFWNHDKSREFLITSRRDQKMTEPLLPGFGTICSGRRIRSVSVMLWRPESEKENGSIPKNFNARTIKSADSKKELEILNYLSLNPSHITHHFPTDPIEKITESKFYDLGRNYFNVLKRILSNRKWFSISRLPNSMETLGLYEWIFTFHEPSQTCIVERISHQSESETHYIGEAKVFDGHFWIEFHDHSKRKHKFFYCQRESINDDLGIIALGMSSSIYGQHGKHAVKELLLSKKRIEDALKKVPNSDTNYITYTSFRDDVHLDPKFKIAFASREKSIINFENPEIKSSQVSRQLEAAKLKGKYVIYQVSLYDSSMLFKTTLEIDSLGIAYMEKGYNDKQNNVYYHGNAELLNDTLRIVLDHKPTPIGSSGIEDKRQFCEIMLHCTDRHKQCYIGQQSDTDVFQFPHASSLIAVKMENLERDYSEINFEATKISFDLESDELKDLWQLVLDEFETFLGRGYSNEEINSLSDLFEIFSSVKFHDYSRKFTRK